MIPASRRLVAVAATALTLVTCLPLLPQRAQAMDFDGYLQESIAGRTSEPDDIIFHRQTVNVKLTERKGRDFMFRFEVDLYLDSADFIDETVRSSSRMREGYLRFSIGDLDLRLGRVQIAWGEAEGVIVSDQVSPFDLENFIIPKFDEIRLGVDGIFADYYFANGDDLQLLWISHFEEPNFPDRNSPWAFIDEDELTGVGATLEDLDKPANQFKNSELGIRYSGHPIVADWAVGYLWSWDDRPSLFQEVGSVTPTIERFHLFTANVVAPVGDYLLKFDTAYEMNRYLSLDPTRGIDPDTIADGLRIKTDVWRGLLGLEMRPNVPYWEQAEASFQYVHEHIMDDHFALTQPEDSDLVSMRLSAAYLNEKIKPWFFVIYDLAGDNWWMQSKVDWEPRDAVRFTVEYNLFEGHAYDGDTGGNFGRFDRNDMVQLTARYSF